MYTTRSKPRTSRVNTFLLPHLSVLVYSAYTQLQGMRLVKCRLRIQRGCLSKLALNHQRRLASTSSHDEHGHQAKEDPNVYTRETFFSPFWRNMAIVSVLGYGTYVALSSKTDDQSFLTRYIAKYTPSTAHWDIINDANLRTAAVGAEDNKIITEAKRPHIHRYRYTGFFDAGIQNNIPLGMPQDIEKTVIRRDYEITHHGKVAAGGSETEQ